MDAIIYIHGKVGSAKEAEHYEQLFPSCDVVGLAYQGITPWDAGKEIQEAVTRLKATYGRIALIANSIGAFFSMNADIEKGIVHAWFISPVVDMEKLIEDIMDRAGITEPELRERGIIPTDFGEDLSWEYLSYVRQHPVSWSIPTDILYGSKDHLTSMETITAFAKEHHASLTVMEGGEHWFHTEEQMLFLGNWIRNSLDNGKI